LTALGGTGTAAGSNGTVTLNATGAVVDGNGAGTNVSSGVLNIVAATGVGSADALETSVVILDVTNSGAGNVQIAEANDVTVNRLRTQGAGNVNLTSGGGAITIATGQSGVSATTGSVSRNANTTLDINAPIVTAGGPVDIGAGGNITSGASGTSTTSPAATRGSGPGAGDVL